MNKSKGSQKNSKRRQLGIRWKMLSIFFAFIVLFTLVIWIFQIQMLIYFYHGVKYKELDATLKEIQMVKDDNLQIVEIASRKAKDNYEDIWVYRVEDGVLNEDRPIVFSDGSHDSRAVFLQRRFDDFYSEAKSNENHFICVFTIEYPNEKSHYEFKFLDDNKGDPDNVPRVNRNLENVSVIYDSVVSEIKGENTFDGIVIENVKTKEKSQILCDGVFVSIGRKPVTKLIENAINLDENGYVIAGENTMTNIGGVYAIGDVRTKPLRQVVTAVGDGANAVYYIEEYLAKP